MKDWGEVARGLEQIDVAALAFDEKAALFEQIKGTICDAKKALLAGDCPTKLAKRIVRAAERCTDSLTHS
jgi:predicted hydrocarbon binding protein